MTDDLEFAPLAEEHLTELAAAIRNEGVYRYIGGEVPSLEAFCSRLQRAIQGPPAHRANQRWLNYLVRSRSTREVLGRLEATVIGGNAEVAFLFDPHHWGKGYATRGLLWLHGQIRREVGEVQFWATTLPQNTQCQALLERCGYARMDAAAGQSLVSYDDGDLVYRLKDG